MAFLRRWLLIFSALLLGGGPLLAAGPRESRAYAAALAAFHDQFYARAESGLTQFLQTYRKSTNAPAAELFLAQSEFYLGKYPNAVARLTDTNNLAKARVAGLADRYVYWTAEAQLARGEAPVAAEIFISLADDFPDSPLSLSALVEGAAVEGRLANWSKVDGLLDDPNGWFQRTAQLEPNAGAVADGWLLLSESKISQADFSAALRVLQRLNPAMLSLEQDWKRAHQFCRANLGLGEPAAALSASTNLLALARLGRGDGWAGRLADSVAIHAGVLEKLGRLDDAGTAWSENLSAGAPGEKQSQAVLKTAELAIIQGNLANAEAGLEKYLAQFSDSPVMELARLTLGELYLKDFIAQPAATNHLVAAQVSFDQLLASATNGPLAGKAFWDRGWCDWLASAYAECLADFTEAAQRLPVSEDLAVARFKMGDAQFAQNDFGGCQTNYQSVLEDFSALPDVKSSLGDRALYQIERARLELHDAPGAEDAMQRLLAQFSTNSPADSSRLLAGEGFSDFGSQANARAVFQKFAAERADSPLLPSVALAVARTFEREQDWPAAVTNYQAWLNGYPTNELRPQVEYARDWAVSQAGDEAGALALFTNFLAQFPTNQTLTPLAQMWVADHYFRLGGTNLVEAERNYELIFQNFSTNELAYPAQLMAGRAAMGRFSYPEAIRSYFTPLINATNCPDELKVQARFAYSQALWEMAASDTNNASLQLATNLLNQICLSNPTNAAGALAWVKIGDYDLQLGAFDAATNAYAQVVDPNAPASAAAGVALRSRAQVGLGLVLEKKAEGLAANDRNSLLTLALNNYLDVLYTDDTVADPFWTKKAGLQALPLMLALKIGDRDQFFDTLERWLPPLKPALEKKRAALTN